MIVNEVSNVRTAVDTGQDDALRSLVGQGLGHIGKVIVRQVARGPVRPSQELAGFGQVRRQDVGIGQKAPHVIAHFLGIRRIDAAIVSHDGVDDDLRIRSFEVVQEIEDHVDLTDRAEKTRADAVEGQLIFLPTVDIRRHAVRIVVEVVIVKAGVNGKDRRRQDTALYL